MCILLKKLSRKFHQILKTEKTYSATLSEIYAVQMMMDRRISELNSEVALEGGGEIQGP